MKKEDCIAYVLIWTFLLGFCAAFIYTIGFRRWMPQKEETLVKKEDEVFYEQLLQENEKQMQRNMQEEQQAANWAALMEMQTQSEHAVIKTAQGFEIKETQTVFAGAAAAFQDSAKFLSECFIVDSNTSLSEADVPLLELLGKNMELSSDASKPQILIYHTHATEGYADSVDGDPSTTVVGIGNYLHELLTVRYGFHVLHVTDAYDLAEGSLERSRAYNYANAGLEQILAEHPSIEVIIDLHRDGVSEEKHLVTEINGKQTAQIMFFNGVSRTNERGVLDSLPNSYIQDNLAFSLQMELLGDHYYPNFVRGIYVKGYRYNLHFRPKSMLLEVGAQTNTVEEAKNAMEPFAEILYKLLKGA